MKLSLQSLMSRISTSKLRPFAVACLLAVTSLANTSLLFLSSSAVHASGIILDLTLDAASLQKSLEIAHKTAPTDWQILLASKSSGRNAPMLLRTYQPFAKGAHVYLDEQMLGADDYDKSTVYARGSLLGVPDSFAFLALRIDGSADVRYTVEGSETRMLIKNGQRTLEQRASQGLNSNGVNPFLDDVAFAPQQQFAMPMPNQTPKSSSVPPVSVQSRTEDLTGGPGWSSVYSLVVPSGQALTGVVSKGPGNAGVVIMTDPNPPGNWRNSTCDYTDGVNTYLPESCLIENPAADTYYVAAYKADSEDTTLAFNYAEALTAHQQLSATVAIDTDAGFYNYFASNNDILDYFAALFGYTSTIFEAETNTELLMGDVFLFSSSNDPYTTTSESAARLTEVKAYWQENRSGIDRTLAAHFSSQDFGGIASIDALCSTREGYSVSGVYGVAPQSGQPLIWDATVFAHELGHNFSSQHTHCYAGEGGNPDPVDACWNSESSCWAGAVDLPGLGSLTGGASYSGNGTIMSYCHQIIGGVSNISPTFGQDHAYGLEASRVSSKMSARAFEVAAIDRSCISINNIPYTVTPSALTGGSISPSSEQTAVANETSDFVLMPDSGYTVDQVTGTCPGSLSANSFTAGPILEDCTVIANFAVIVAPSGVSIMQTDIGGGEIYLYVSVASDGGGSIESYDASCTDGTSTFTGTSSTPTIEVTGLTNGTAYTCSASATNAVGSSGASASTDSITPEALPTGLPIWLLYKATE